ncbi:MAG TPA: ABC transporter permease [Thermoleophilaceae bacterium]|nr:ABC transporter permease [Thermoleophilaceae bacterium]
MTGAALSLAGRRPAPPSALSASWTFALRVALKLARVPEQAADAVLIPVIFTVLFTYVFGGALAGSTDHYLQFLLPGTLVFTVLLIPVYAGVGLSSDRASGMLDRFRSLPVWRPAIVVGALMGEAARCLVASALVIGLGLAMGFRPAGGAAGVLAAVVLVVLFGVSLGWMWAALGLLVRTPTAVSTLSLVIQFPLVFTSNVFVDPKTMPAGLRAFADANPVSLLVTTVRDLMAGTASTGHVGLVLASAASITAVFATLTLRLYQSR